MGAPGPTTTSIDEDVKELRAEVHKFETAITAEVRELRSQVRSATGVARWAATVLMTFLLTSGLGAVIWGARLDARVSGMELRLDDKFKALETRMDDKFQVIDERFKAVDARFDKLEAAILRAIEQARTQAPPPK